MLISRESFKDSGSSTARALAMAAFMAILYLSLTPLTGWHDLGVSPLQFLVDGFPRYWTWGESIANVVAYLVLGFLLGLSLYPRWRGLAAASLSLFACSGLSFTMEALQTYNPARYPQVRDWLLNTLGGLLGALIAWYFTRPLLVTGWVRKLRRQWLERHSHLGIVLLVLWPLLSYFPQHQLFATGRLLDGPTVPDPGSWSAALLQLHLGPIVASEVLGIGFGVLTFAYICSEVLSRQAPKLLVVLCGVSLACAFRTLAVSVSSRDLPALGWLTMNAQLGIVLGMLACIGLLRLPSSSRRAAGLALLLASIVLTNILPFNAYFAMANLPWATPSWNNLRATMDLAALLWPYAAIVFLVYRLFSTTPSDKTQE
jgi:VanZ family protein